jgi:hypothetical protein
MLGVGQTEYDYEHDGESNALGGCTVCFVFFFFLSATNRLYKFTGEHSSRRCDDKVEIDVLEGYVP